MWGGGVRGCVVWCVAQTSQISNGKELIHLANLATCCGQVADMQPAVGFAPTYTKIVRYISLYSSLEWTAGCKITGCEKQVAYQQPAHSRLPNLQDDLIMNSSKFNNAMHSTWLLQETCMRSEACLIGLKW